MWINLLMSFAD